MKKPITILFLFAIILNSYSQVFNSGEILKKGKFAAGLEPTYLINSDYGKLFLFVHGNYGLRSDIGLNMKIGVGGSQTYVGAAMTWGLTKNFTLTTGVHNFKYFGLDARLNLNIPLQSDARIFTGFDASVLFANDIQLPLWLPVGVEVRLPDKLSFILEAEIAINKPAYHLIGLGVAYYF